MRLKLRAKLVLSYVLILISMSGVAYLALQSANATQAAYSDLLDRRDKMIMAVGDLARQIDASGRDAGWYALTGNSDYLDHLKAAEKQAQADVVFLDKNAETDADKALVKSLQGENSIYWAGIGDTIRSFQNVTANGQQLDQHMGVAIAIPLRQSVNRVNKAVADMERHQTDESEAARDKAARDHGRFMWLIIGIGGAVTVLALAFAWWMSGRVTRPVIAMAEAAKRLAEGDLTAAALQASANDETRDLAVAFNQMLTGLRQLIGGVTSLAGEVADLSGHLTRTTGDVAEGAKGVAKTIGQVSHGAVAQTGSVDEAMRVVEEVRTAIAQVAGGAQEQARSAQSTTEVLAAMMAAIRDVSAKADKVDASSDHAVARAQQGGQVVERTTQGMARIQQAVQVSGEQIRELGHLSGQIGAITAAITEIADQTNLLALNAAIEAARAGDQGRGFAVVADEVRKLAERSGKSATEIGALIGAIQSGTAKAVAIMEQVIVEVQNGSQLAGETRTSLQEILSVVETTTRDVDAIKAATEVLTGASQKVAEAATAVAAITEENTATAEEMAAGADQLTSAMAGIAAVAGQNAAAAEEVTDGVTEVTGGIEVVSASTQMLLEIAGRLNTEVSRFRM
ncbi:MAG TPA: methyl-accepting chemotaxis protein [Symbiobacteriaceae bacterium]|jgi:methyl-accepting chemotaxis protein